MNVEFKGSYDREKNLSIVQYIGTPKSKEEIEYLANKSMEIWRGDGVNKVWNITDLSGMGMASPQLVIHYNKVIKDFVKDYLADYVVVAKSTMQRIATSLFNTFMGERHTIVESLDEAKKVIDGWQAEKGRRIPL